MSSALKVDKLRKEFGGLVAVKDVSFEVNGGEWEATELHDKIKKHFF